MGVPHVKVQITQSIFAAMSGVIPFRAHATFQIAAVERRRFHCDFHFSYCAVSNSPALWMWFCCFAALAPLFNFATLSAYIVIRHKTTQTSATSTNVHTS